MPALAPYIPPKDADFALWSANFAGLIVTNPMRYGLVAGDAASIAAVDAAFQAAYSPVTSKSTKTAQAVSDKNIAKVNALSTERLYAQRIALNPGVSSGDKIALGLNPRTSTPAKITPPASNPVLSVQSAAALSMIVRYRDSAASPSVKSKPYGVIACQIFGKTSATPITDPTGLPLLAAATKSPLVLTFDPADGGKQLYLAARWAIRTGGVSPWSSIVSFTIPSA